LRGKVQLTRFAVSGNLDMAALAAAGQSASAPPDPTSALNRVRLDLRLTSSPQLGFQNSIATLAGDVDLHIRGTAASPSVLGRIDITQGKATFAGTQYTLQRGDILFTNPVTIEPELNLQATARVRDYDIMIGLNGTANKLQVNYRSEPPLSQADVLALLALGRTNEEAAMYGEQEQVGSNPTTEALLGGALNAAVSNRVQRLFGVASVRVDPNFVGVLGQSTARVTVEQQVGRNVTLVFATNVNTTAQQLLQAQYDITRNLSIIAVRDEADVFSLYFQIRGKHR
jgi:translocation and assembly module TamB